MYSIHYSTIPCLAFTPGELVSIHFSPHPSVLFFIDRIEEIKSRTQVSVIWGGGLLDP